MPPPKDKPQRGPLAERIFRGDSELARLSREKDWAKTPLGPMESWSPSLRTAASLVVASPVPMIVLWGSELVQIYNDGYRDVMGAKHPAGLGQRTRDCWPEVWSFNAPLYAGVMERGKSFQFEDQRLSIERNGYPEEAFFTLTFSPVAGDAGEVGGVLVTVRETTAAMARARAEVALQESQERYRELFDSLIEAYCVIEVIFDDGGKAVDFRYLETNPAFVRQSTEPMLGKRIKEIVPEVEPFWLDHYGRVATTGEPARFEHAVAGLGNQVFRTSAFRVGGSDSRRVAIAFENITEKKRAEEALTESETRYRTLFESMSEGFCIIEAILDDNGRGVDHRFLEVNPAFERHTGLPNPVGKTARELVANIEPRWPELYGRVATTGVRERFVEYSEAMGRWFEVDAFPLGEPGERKVALLFSDITERVRAEHRLQETDRRKDEFLAVLGHELRNPLAPLRTGLDLLEQARNHPALLDSLRPMMDRQLSHLTRLVDDLLDMSRISQGKITLTRAPLDLNHALEAAVEQAAGLLEQRGHELSVHISERPLRIDGDFERLTQVIANLLTNAAHYSEPRRKITIRTDRDGNRAVLRVQDEGYGIPTERLSQLFRMFSQVPEHREMSGSGGLGIGLALSQQLLRLHGGTIEAVSEGLGRGSEFIVRLPLNLDLPQSPEAPESAAARSGHRRILIVDDNVDAADSLGLILRLKGHEVEVAHEGRSALERLQAFQPDVVLLDIGLPGWDGIEVARRIRKLPTGRHIRLVALTGWGQEENRRRTQEAGFDDHLTKPVGIAELVNLID